MRSLKTKCIEWVFISIVFSIILGFSFCLSYALLVIVNFFLENFDIFWIAFVITVLFAIKMTTSIFFKMKQ